MTAPDAQHAGVPVWRTQPLSRGERAYSAAPDFAELNRDVEPGLWLSLSDDAQKARRMELFDALDGSCIYPLPHIVLETMVENVLEALGIGGPA